MPKFIVVTIFIVLLVGIIGGGGWLAWQKFNNANKETQVKESNKKESDALFGALPDAEQATGEATDVASPSDSGDDDGDGLSNQEEATWGTDPNNPDTDGDGYLDGEEVAANHNPTIPAPDDLLPTADNNKVSPAEAPPTTTGLSMGEVEQYFADDLDLTGGSSNLTEEYNSEYAEGDRSPATMSEYANKRVIIDKLPRPDKESLPEPKEDTPAMIAQYLAVANNKEALANSALYSQAEMDLYSQKNPTTMQSLAKRVDLFRSSLLNTPVPKSAVPVHAMLLGYTELLSATFNEIALWNDDPVKSMVGTRQLEVIDRKYYPIIQNELQRLEALQ